MKKIYFIRHGESQTNASRIYIGASSLLTKKGLEQAVLVAERCTKIKIDIVISSTFPRAKQTADVIAEKINKPIELSQLFGEKRRPSKQIGLAKDDAEPIRLEQLFIKNFPDPNFRNSDGENFTDLKKRALEALSFLAHRPEENILVVTHGFFMRMLLACAVIGEDLSGAECEKFVQKFHMENTSITVFGYDETKKKSPWWIWVWNDHAHLG